MFKNNKKYLIILSTIIIIVILLIAILIQIKKTNDQKQFLQQEKQRVMQYTSISEFKNIEEVFIYLDIIIDKKEEHEVENVDYSFYVRNLKPIELQNENYYKNLIQYSASVLNYKNFIIQSETPNIVVTVMCNEQETMVSEYYINGEEYYFEKLKNKENIKKYSQEIEKNKSNISRNQKLSVKISSEELKNIISENWKTANINLGTKESTYRNYDIYFDEGYEIKKINGSVFNIIFTDEYTKDIIENLKVNSKTEEIEEQLGEPTYKSSQIVGYRLQNFYIFFEENQISIYPIINYETKKVAEILEKSNENNLDLNTLINEIKSIWNDYDIFETNENEIILQYTLKGICIKYNYSADKGIVIYNNYNGYVSGNLSIEDVIKQKENLPNNMHFINEDLVFTQEQKRLNSQDDTTQYRNYRTQNILNTSNKFKLNIDSYTNQVRFISINKEMPNYELREKMNYGIWYDDYTFIYSVKERGIYKYNLKENIYSTIIEGNNEYKLKEIINNKLFFDNEDIEL